MTNTQLRDRLAGAAASLRRRVDRREVAWVIGTTAALIVVGGALFTVTASAGRVVESLLELPAALAQTGLVPFVVWAVLAVLVVALVAAITVGHRGVVVATVVVAGLVVIGAVDAPVPGDRWEFPTPRQEPLPANYTPCFSGS